MTGHVYFIGNGELIKIGFSSNVRSRLKSLRTMSSVPLDVIGFVAGSVDDERAMHRTLAAHRRQGEWFADCAEVRTEIARVSAEGFEPRQSPEAPSACTAEARFLAEIVTRITGWTNNDTHGDFCGIDGGLLWAIKFRPKRPIGADEIDALGSAALAALDAEIARLFKQRETVVDLIEARSSQWEKIEFLTTKLAALEGALASLRGGPEQ